MKTIILAAVAAAFVSNAHASEPTFAESCGHIENHTRFNPTELSEYQECWLGFHKPDEMAGVLGNIFWARAGESFVSMPVSELRSAGSKSAAKAIVVDRIVEVVNNERIEMLEADLEESQATIRSLEAARDALVAAGVTQDAIDALNEQIAGEAGRIMVAVTAALTLNNVEYASAMALYDAGGTAARTDQHGRVWIDIDSAIQNGGAIQLFALTNALYGEGAENLVTDARDEYLAGRSTAAQFVAVLRADIESGVDVAAAIAAARTAAHNGYTLDVTGNTQADSAISGSTSSDRMCVADCDGFAVFHKQYTFTPAGGVSIEGGYFATDIEAVNGIVEEAYDAGFDTGYDEGYADGYADGFRDGVNSVGS